MAKYEVPPGMPLKIIALRRLESEGRVEEFRARQHQIIKKLKSNGGPCGSQARTAAFYAALHEFPPLGEVSL